MGPWARPLTHAHTHQLGVASLSMQRGLSILDTSTHERVMVVVVVPLVAVAVAQAVLG